MGLAVLLLLPYTMTHKCEVQGWSNHKFYNANVSPQDFLVGA